VSKKREDGGAQDLLETKTSSSSDCCTYGFGAVCQELIAAE
jgi:hypothetical protein